jgi:hypothetical protein
MKLTYRTDRYKEKPSKHMSFLWKIGDIREIILREIDKVCCNDMREAMEENYIAFGDYDVLLNRNNDVNIFHCSPYPEGPCWSTMAIKYCPFCAEEIITEETLE